MNTQPIKIKRALLSVSDKTDILSLAQALIQQGIEIIATDGTAQFLSAANIPITHISDITHYPEMMDGRVKTLHPNIHGALLGKRDKHAGDAQKYNIEWIDLVVCNLYPFIQHNTIENIDIGGVSLLRSAAKNREWVTVLSDCMDYPRVIAQLTTGIDFSLRHQLAAKAFAHVATYDAHIAAYFNDCTFPAEHTLPLTLQQPLTYGENPHQQASWYVKDINPFNPPLQGKPLSFNNIADASGALTCLNEFIEPTCVIVKHANPCSISSANTIELAFQQAWHSDSLSAFGGIIALNRACTEDIADFLTQVFIEIVIAPDFTAAARSLFQRKPNVRLLKLNDFPIPLEPLLYKQVVGGMLIQTRDTQILQLDQLQKVTAQTPSLKQLQDMQFAWQALKHIKSNSIVIAKNLTTVGIGAGQVSRIDAVELAIHKAQDRMQDCILASDGFFPFADSIALIANKTPIKAIIQPGGSIRDKEVIAACDREGIAMVFTGIRCFAH